MLTAALLNAAPLQAAEVLDATAALVNNSIILKSELDATQKRIQASNRSIGDLEARKAAMEQLIATSLVYQSATEQGVDLTDSQLDEALNDMAMRNHTTPDQILQGSGANLTRAQQREEFKKQIIMSEFRRTRVSSRIHASETEVKTLAEQLKTQGSIEPRYHLGQIIVPLSEAPTFDEYGRAQKNANAVKASLQRGENFSTIAARYASGSNAGAAGDLGWLPETQVPLPFVPSLIKARPGDVVGPFRSQMGLHILKVFDISTEAITPITTYHASHILVRTSIIFSDEAARAKINDIRNDILEGRRSFADAAKQFSEDPGSAVDGGSLGYAVPSRYDPAFAEVMVSLKKGEISQPFKSSFGWHIILLNDIRVDTSSDEAYRDRARNLILDRKFNEESQIWEKELRDSAYIQILDPELLSGGVSLDQKGGSNAQ